VLTRYRPSTTESDAAKRLHSYLLPVLRTVSRMKELTALVVPPGEHPSAQLQRVLEAAAKQAKVLQVMN